MEIFTRWQDFTIEEYKQLIKNWEEKYYQMKEERNKQKEVLDKIKEYIKEHQRKDEFLTLNEWQTRELLELLEEIE